MNVGLIARSESRGLGNMTLEFYRHMQPAKTLLVIPAGVASHGLTSHTGWYPDATVVGFDGTLNEAACREFLDGLDVVYSAETFYDWRFCAWARDAGVRTVCHLMPEWLPPVRAADPDVWWAPTSWRLERCPEGTVHVPVPIATDRFTPSTRSGGVFRWLHVAGAQTHGDRNGTDALLRAARLLTQRQEIVIRSQTHGVGYGEVAPNVTVVHQGHIDDYWAGYDDVDACVMPRRYAGLSLPVLEAFGAGLPVMMSDLSPQQSDWPVRLIQIRGRQDVTIPGYMLGRTIAAYDTDPRELARTMDEWVARPHVVDKWRVRAREFAKAHSWDVWADRYRELLAA